MAINDRYMRRYTTRNDEIVANLREVAGASPPVDPKMAAKKKVAEAAILMALAHGGVWRVQYEPERGLIVVARRRRRPRQSL